MALDVKFNDSIENIKEKIKDKSIEISICSKIIK